MLLVGITFIIVTHDQDEALSMADRVAVMEEGKVRQIAPPGELYEFPAVLDNVAYHGSESHMFFTTDSGAKLTATVQNETRMRAPVNEGERLWVSWIPGDTLVLAE